MTNYTKELAGQKLLTEVHSILLNVTLKVWNDGFDNVMPDLDEVTPTAKKLIELIGEYK